MKLLPLGHGRFAKVDDRDFGRASKLSWSASKSKSGWYALADLRSLTGRHKLVRLHRFILDAPPGIQVDHWNGDGLDCRRKNLRLATNQQNAANKRSDLHSSRFKGVHWDRRRGKWFAQIHVNYRTLALGRFINERQAAEVYDAAAREHFGEFARTNF